MFKTSLLSDFEQFKSASTDQRISLVQKICEQFNTVDFKPSELNIVHDILSFLAMDVETEIRKTISESLKERDDIPHALAKRLAYDSAEVAMPILEFSEILTADDLVAIIESTTEVLKLSCIARRKHVPENVSLALIEKEIDEIIQLLLNNKGARINALQKELIFDLFSTSGNIIDALVSRGGLSPALAQKITLHTSKAVASDISTDDLSPELAMAAAQNARERFSVEIISGNLDAKQTHNLVEEMHKTNELTHSAILRAFVKGDFEFFTYGTSLLAGIAHENTIKLTESKDINAFAALFKAANMPTSMHQACFILIDTIKEAKKKTKNNDDYFNFLTESIINNQYDKDIPNMRYFVALINGMKIDENPE